MSAGVVVFDEVRVRKYVIKAFEQFLNDPPDTDFQRGFLAGLTTVYREALGGRPDARVDVCERLIRSLTPEAQQ